MTVFLISIRHLYTRSAPIECAGTLAHTHHHLKFMHMVRYDGLRVWCLYAMEFCERCVCLAHSAHRTRVHQRPAPAALSAPALPVLGRTSSRRAPLCPPPSFDGRRKVKVNASNYSRAQTHSYPARHRHNIKNQTCGTHRHIHTLYTNMVHTT